MPEGVDTFKVAKSDIQSSETKLIDLLTESSAVFPSSGELRKLPRATVCQSTRRK